MKITSLASFQGVTQIVTQRVVSDQMTKKWGLLSDKDCDTARRTIRVTQIVTQSEWVTQIVTQNERHRDRLRHKESCVTLLGDNDCDIKCKTIRVTQIAMQSERVTQIVTHREDSVRKDVREKVTCPHLGTRSILQSCACVRARDWHRRRGRPRAWNMARYQYHDTTHNTTKARFQNFERHGCFGLLLCSNVSPDISMTRPPEVWEFQNFRTRSSCVGLLFCGIVLGVCCRQHAACCSVLQRVAVW